jgi:hypothetical protein
MVRVVDRFCSARGMMLASILAMLALSAQALILEEDVMLHEADIEAVIKVWPDFHQFLIEKQGNDGKPWKAAAENGWRNALIIHDVVLYDGLENEPEIYAYLKKQGQEARHFLNSVRRVLQGRAYISFLADEVDRQSTLSAQTKSLEANSYIPAEARAAAISGLKEAQESLEATRRELKVEATEVELLERYEEDLERALG